MDGTPAPKGSCKEPRNQFHIDGFSKNTLIFGVIIVVIAFTLEYFNII